MASRAVMDIHPDVDIRNEIAAAQPFQLVTLGKAVEAAKQNITTPEGRQRALPFRIDGQNLSRRIHSADHPLCNMDLVRRTRDVPVLPANCSVVVLVFVPVEISEDKPADADVSELLSYVGTSAAKTDHSSADAL
jgi:hypothetical protein